MRGFLGDREVEIEPRHIGVEVHRFPRVLAAIRRVGISPGSLPDFPAAQDRPAFRVCLAGQPIGTGGDVGE